MIVIPTQRQMELLSPLHTQLMNKASEHRAPICPQHHPFQLRFRNFWTSYIRVNEQIRLQQVRKVCVPATKKCTHIKSKLGRKSNYCILKKERFGNGMSGSR